MTIKMRFRESAGSRTTSRDIEIVLEDVTGDTVDAVLRSLDKTEVACSNCGVPANEWGRITCFDGHRHTDKAGLEIITDDWPR
jgi:hypothetical protein